MVALIHWTVEKSPSKRATCRQCKTLIDVGETRIGGSYNPHSNASARHCHLLLVPLSGWRHLKCWKPPPRADDLPKGLASIAGYNTMDDVKEKTWLAETVNAQKAKQLQQKAQQKAQQPLVAIAPRPEPARISITPIPAAAGAAAAAPPAKMAGSTLWKKEIPSKVPPKSKKSKTVPELKEILKANHVAFTSKLKKADLLALVNNLEIGNTPPV